MKEISCSLLDYRRDSHATTNCRLIVELLQARQHCNHSRPPLLGLGNDRAEFERNGIANRIEILERFELLELFQLSKVLDLVLRHVQYAEALQRVDTLHLLDEIVADPELLERVAHRFESDKRLDRIAPEREDAQLFERVEIGDLLDRVGR